jgi:hypothetical protein
MAEGRMTDMADKGSFIEEILLNLIKKLLAGRVNELLGEAAYPIPPVEFGQSGYSGASGGVYAVTPVVRLSTGERSEKERIIRVEVYLLTVTFTVPEYPDGERDCYAYASAVAAALGEDPTLGGIVDRAELTGKKYSPPKCAGMGEDWGITLTLRIITKGAGV